MDIQERIKKIEEEIRVTPYHKETQHHIGLLRARIARLKEEQLSKKGAGGGVGFDIKKEGDATVILVGPPSVGKSTLLNTLSGASSKVAAYPFTTLTVIPGMMDYKGAKIQLFDLPGIIKGAARGIGKGREVIAVARTADLVLIMVDVQTINLIAEIKNELSEAGLRLDKRPPQITIKKKIKGGLEVYYSKEKNFPPYELIKQLFKDFGILNAEVYLKERLTLEEINDALIGRRNYIPSLVFINKEDLLTESMKNDLKKNFPETLIISAQNKKISMN